MGPFKKFRFSPFKTIVAIALALIMLRASAWQWERYNFKLELIDKIESNTGKDAEPFSESNFSEISPSKLLHRKIAVEGSYDLDRQMIVINRTHATGPGYWLLAPLKMKNSKKAVIVSRGFIPFADRTPDTWSKYDKSGNFILSAMVQKSVEPKILTPKNKPTGGDSPFLRKLLYPDVEVIAKQLPYEVIPGIILQRIDTGPNLPPGEFRFPAEDIRIDVPPEVHYGYTFEWIFLAFSTLLVSFLLQAFPRNPMPMDKEG